jgi:hypothetical protein
MTRVFLAFSLAASVFLSFACVQKGGNGTTADTGDTIRIGVYGDTRRFTSVGTERCNIRSSWECWRECFSTSRRQPSWTGEVLAKKCDANARRLDQRGKASAVSI